MQMHSPLNSPFLSDGLLNYSLDQKSSSSQLPKFEKKLILHYIVNHSFQLLFDSYYDKLSLQVSVTELIRFTVALFKRLQLSLRNFQKLLLLMNRYFTKLELQQTQLKISLKMMVTSLLIKVVGMDHDDSTDWSLVTGLPLTTIQALVKFIDSELVQEDYEFSEDELEIINAKMKALIYSRFDVI